MPPAALGVRSPLSRQSRPRLGQPSSARAAVVSLAMGPSINIIWTKVRLKALRGLSPHSGRWSMAAVTLMSNRPITGLVARPIREAGVSCCLCICKPFSCFLGFLNPVQLQITVEHSPLMFLRRHVLPNMFPTPDTVDEYRRCWKSKKNSNYQPGNYNQITLQKLRIPPVRAILLGKMIT